MDFQKFDALTEGEAADGAQTRRSMVGLLAGALIAAGFVGAQSAEARRKGGNNGRGGRGGNGRGGRGNGGRGGNGRGGRRNNH